MKPQARWIILPFILVAASLACNLPSNVNNTPAAAQTLVEMYTAAALTVQASGSQSGSATAQTTATNPFPTYSLLTPSSTPAPVVYCDAAAFVKDVTISDGTTLGRNSDFTKTWRIRNIGTCTWSPSYALVFVNGDRLGAPNSVALPAYVYPGQTIDLAVDMTAPNKNGHYQGFWELRNAAGAYFGIGAQAQGAFWVDINVSGPTYTAYDFVAHYCDAQWVNNDSSLSCPGSQGDSQGFVVRLDNPVMESGKTEDEAGLLTVPKNVNNGIIQGQYPAVNVKDGDRFHALIDCQYNSNSCNVYFRLAYQIGGGAIQTLGQWNEAYEGKYTPLDIDLSSLDGQNVKFILMVTANGSPKQDNAVWVAPHITRLGNPPPTNTPTSTFTPTATLTPTSTNTPTYTPTATPTSTPTSTPTDTPTPTSTP